MSTDPAQTAEFPTPGAPLAEVARAMYLERRSGTVVIEKSTAEKGFMVFREGELYLDSADPAADDIGRFFVGTPPAPAAAPPALRAAVESLARDLGEHPAAPARLAERPPIVVELLGPLPTVYVLLELAFHRCGSADLLARLGGEQGRLRSSDRTPAMHQLPGLEPAMARILALLEHPATVSDVLRIAGGDRLAALQALSKLWAIGLAVPAEARADNRDIVTAKVLRRFLARIEDSLAAEPVATTPGEHRRLLADLIARMGSLNHYELLGVEVGVDSDGVFEAYNRLARLIHPSHADRLGAPAMRETAKLVFERATEAYLTLSDPKRRASYNMMSEVNEGADVGAAQRQTEKRRLAQLNYQRALLCLAEMDYSSAVDLLKEATRMDPRAEYFEGLGRAQAKNPNWRHHAVRSYRRAVEMNPRDAGLRVAYGGVLEEIERIDEAREQYRAALDSMPDHIEAQAALDRLGDGLRGLLR